MFLILVLVKANISKLKLHTDFLVRFKEELNFVILRRIQLIIC
jgi:hypothetical protein